MTPGSKRLPSPDELKVAEFLRFNPIGGSGEPKYPHRCISSSERHAASSASDGSGHDVRDDDMVIAYARSDTTTLLMLAW